MSQQITSSVSYQISEESVYVDEAVKVCREVGDSEFPYVLIGANPDDDGSDVIAFGFHANELPGLPLPEDD